MEPRILFEDPSILVLAKPAFLTVNRAETTIGCPTLQDWIERLPYWEKILHTKGNQHTDYFRQRSGLVHRLDKDTSGVMVVAKTREAFLALIQEFAQGHVEKTYLTLVHGKLFPQEGEVRLPLARSRRDRQKFSVSPFGKKAGSKWRVLRVFDSVQASDVDTRSYQGFSYLEVYPQTGRTHQIRVHLAHLRHPIVGDERYSGKRRAREDRKWCPRQFLHAFRISFVHPDSGKRVEFRLELPSDLQTALKFLG